MVLGGSDLTLLAGSVALTVAANRGCAPGDVAWAHPHQQALASGARGAAADARAAARARVSLPQRLLGGLRAYHLAPGDAEPAAPPAAAKKGKKQARPLRAHATRGSGAAAHARTHQAGVNLAAVEHAFNQEGVRRERVSAKRTRLAAALRLTPRPCAAAQAPGTNVGTFPIAVRAVLVRPLYRQFAAVVSIALLCAANTGAAAALGAGAAARTVVPVLAFITAVRIHARTALARR
jgi:hypothetical protein